MAASAVAAIISGIVEPIVSWSLNQLTEQECPHGCGNVIIDKSGLSASYVNGLMEMGRQVVKRETEPETFLQEVSKEMAIDYDLDTGDVMCGDCGGVIEFDNQGNVFKA